MKEFNIYNKKYKRFFAFGCSFTGYKWPTWADIIHNEMKYIEYYNYGVGGAGNLQIMAKLSQANNKFKFNQDDLIAVMFTSFNREDRWVNGNWISLGNIYNQREYSEEWVMKFADPTGYIIRDLSLIDMMSNYIKSLSSDSIVLTSYPLDDSLENIIGSFDTNIVQQINKNYSSLIKSIPIYRGLKEDLMNRQLGFIYKNERGEQFHDTHPTPTEHLKYMRASGFVLESTADLYADTKTKELLSLSKINDIINIRPVSLSEHHDNRL